MLLLIVAVTLSVHPIQHEEAPMAEDPPSETHTAPGRAFGR